MERRVVWRVDDGSGADHRRRRKASRIQRVRRWLRQGRETHDGGLALVPRYRLPNKPSPTRRTRTRRRGSDRATRQRKSPASDSLAYIPLSFAPWSCRGPARSRARRTAPEGRTAAAAVAWLSRKRTGRLDGSHSVFHVERRIRHQRRCPRPARRAPQSRYRRQSDASALVLPARPPRAALSDARGRLPAGSGALSGTEREVCRPCASPTAVIVAWP